MPRQLSLRPPGADYEIRVVGSRSHPLRDFYYAMLGWTWPTTLSVIVIGYLLLNALFAAAFEAVGGIEHCPPDSFRDAFFFSVQTMGTIGYGAMYPVSLGANCLVVAESLVSLLFTALATGLVFAKFSRPNARVTFTRRAVICPFDGVPTFMFRLGNDRGNAIVDAQLRVVVSRTERTAEGAIFYRSYEVPLLRDRALSLRWSFNMAHRIDAGSPFFGQNAASIVEQEYEVFITVIGIDDVTMQTVHAAHTYYPRDIVFDHRLVDVVSTLADGSLLLDLGKFDEIEPCGASSEPANQAPRA